MNAYEGLFAALRHSALAVGIAALGTANAHAQFGQLDVWEVFMKVSPCSPTLRDWMTVAPFNPTGLGGSNHFLPISSLPPGNRFPRTPAGFTAAQAAADIWRIAGFGASGESTGQPKYENYCCKDHRVWRQRQPDGSSTLVALQGEIPPPAMQNFFFEAGPMCCEHAGALAGQPGGCNTFQLSNGASVVLTLNGVFPAIPGTTIAIGPLVIPPTGLSFSPVPPTTPPPTIGLPPSPPRGPTIGTPPSPERGPTPQGPPVFGVPPRAPTLGSSGTTGVPPPPPPPPVVARVEPRSPTPTEAYYVFALDRGIGLVVATQETVRSRPYCTWNGGGTQPCPAPANVLATYGGPYPSVDAARADMRTKLDCERGHWGTFIRQGEGRHWLQNNIGGGDCRSMKQH